MRREKKRKRLLSGVLVLLLALSMAVQSNADALSDAQKEKERLEQSLADAKALVNQLKSSKASTQEKADQLNKQLDTVNANVSALEKQLSSINTTIDENETALSSAQEQEKLQYESMKKRIQYTYENGSSRYLDIIFSAQDMAEVINAVEYSTMLIQYDRQMLAKYQQMQEEIQKTQENLKQQYTAAAEKKAEIANQQEAVELLVAAKEEELGDISQDLTQAQALEKAYQQEVKAQQEVLEQIQAVIAAENAAAENGTDSTTDTISSSGFQWPCPSYTRISSDYGPRPSPTAGASTTHKGIDLAAPGGSNILAAQSGKVVIAKYSTSAGNYVTINHGKDASGHTIMTTYMHASSLLVSVGDTVERGQVIAKVGSTGYSTGNHLHFGVTVDGNYVSPWTYLSKP